MTPYWILILIASLLAVMAQFSAPSREPKPRDGGRGVRGRWTAFDPLLIALLVTFSAVRYYVGTDYGLYLTLYRRLNFSNWGAELSSSPQEAGYTILALTVRHLFESDFAIMWAASLLTIVPAYIAIKRTSSNFALSLFLYISLAFYLAPLNIIRQGIAVSLNLLAATYLGRRRSVFVILNVIASTFHATALIAAVVQFAVHRKRPKLTTFGIILGVGVAIATVFAQFSGAMNFLTVLNPRYEMYLSTEESGLGTYLLIGSRIALLLFCILMARRGSVRFLIFPVVGIFFLIIGTQSIVLSRMELYFGIFLVLTVPESLRLLSTRSERILVGCLIAVAAASYYFAYLQNYANLVPYRTYIDSWL